jgi:hypothetical protein
MTHINTVLVFAGLFLASLLTINAPCFAQTAITSELTDESDEIFFSNGDRLTGHLLDVTGGSIRFFTKAIGEVIISRRTVKEIRSKGRSLVFVQSAEMGSREGSNHSPDGVDSFDGSRIPNVDAREPAGVSALRNAPLASRSQAGPLACGSPFWLLSITAPPESVIVGTQSQQTLGGLMTVDICERTGLNDLTIAIDGKHTKSAKIHMPAVTTDVVDGYLEQKHAFHDPYGTGIYGRAEMFFNTSLGLAMERSFAVGVFSPVFGDRGKRNWSFSTGADVRYVGERLYSTAQSLNLAGVRLEEQSAYHTGRFGINEEAWIIPMFNDVHALQGYVRGGPCISIVPWLSASLTEEEHYLGNAPLGSRKNYLASSLSLTIQNSGSIKSCK